MQRVLCSVLEEAGGAVATPTTSLALPRRLATPVRRSIDSKISRVLVAVPRAGLEPARVRGGDSGDLLQIVRFGGSSANCRQYD